MHVVNEAKTLSVLAMCFCNYNWKHRCLIEKVMNVYNILKWITNRVLKWFFYFLTNSKGQLVMNINYFTENMEWKKVFHRYTTRIDNHNIF